MAGRFCFLPRHILSAFRNPNGHRLFPLAFTALDPHPSSGCGGRLERFSTSMYKDFADRNGRLNLSSGKLPDTADDDTLVLLCLVGIFDVSFSVSVHGERRKVTKGYDENLFLKSISLMDKEEVKKEYSRLSARIYLDVKAGNLEALENFRILQIIFFYYYFGFKSNEKKVFDFKTKDLDNLASYCRTLSERVPDVDVEEFRRNSPYEGKDLIRFFFKIPGVTSGMPHKIAEDYKSSSLSACQEMMKWMCLMVKEGYFEVPWEACEERADTVCYLYKLYITRPLLRHGKPDDFSVSMPSFMEEDASVKECTLFLLSKALGYRNREVC